MSVSYDTLSNSFVVYKYKCPGCNSSEFRLDRIIIIIDIISNQIYDLIHLNKIKKIDVEICWRGLRYLKSSRYQSYRV